MAFTDELYKLIAAGLHMGINTIAKKLQDNQDYIKDRTSEHSICTQNRASQPLANLHRDNCGFVWIHLEVTTTEQTLDTGVIDWRNRDCSFEGVIIGETNSYLPGAANDHLVYQTLPFDEDGARDKAHGADQASLSGVQSNWFSGSGSKDPDFDGLPNYSGGRISGMEVLVIDSHLASDSGPVYLYANEVGDLVCKRGTSGDNVRS